MTAPRVAGILSRITERRRSRLGSEVPAHGGETAPLARADHPFLAALAARPGRAVIAEVKMGSPRVGDLRDRVDPLEQARAYGRAGAAALSVVVEPDFFFGSYELLSKCRDVSGLPAIAKDFVVHSRQIEMAEKAGADAILLIAALYERRDLLAYARRARELGLAPLVETHDPSDLEKLEGEPWELVGVNNRDLRTFTVGLENSISLAPRLPPRALRVAESGIAENGDVSRLRAAGFDAFLIGESLLLAKDPAAKLGELVA